MNIYSNDDDGDDSNDGDNNNNNNNTVEYQLSEPLPLKK
jgi:hypothetical protein